MSSVVDARVVDAFETGAALIDLRDTVVVVAVSGSDASDYLQRMISGDLRLCTGGDDRGISAALMTHKGKMIAAFDIYRDGDGFRILLEASAAPALREQLEKFVILEDVSVCADQTAVVVTSLQGGGASALLTRAFSLDPLPEEELALRCFSVGSVPVSALRRPRCRAGGWDLVMPSAVRDAVAESLREAGAVEVSGSDAEPFRIEAGIPRFGVDASDAHMPPESGFDAALSFDKGCYAGQEVVARIRTYGHVNKLLRRIRFEGAAIPAAGDPVRVGEKEMGHVTSACVSPVTGLGVALAYVRIKGGEVGVAVTVDGRESLSGTVEALGVSGAPA